MCIEGYAAGWLCRHSGDPAKLEALEQMCRDMEKSLAQGTAPITSKRIAIHRYIVFVREQMANKNLRKSEFSYKSVHRQRD